MLLVFGCLFLHLDLRIPWHNFIEQILYAFSFLGLISCSYSWGLGHWSFSLFSLLVFGCSIFLALTFNMVFFSSADQVCWWRSPWFLLLLLLLVLLIPNIFIWLFFLSKSQVSLLNPPPCYVFIHVVDLSPQVCLFSLCVAEISFRAWIKFTSGLNNSFWHLCDCFVFGGGMLMSQCVWQSEDSFWGLVLSFHHVSSWDWIQIIRLGSRSFPAEPPHWLLLIGHLCQTNKQKTPRPKLEALPISMYLNLKFKDIKTGKTAHFFVLQFVSLLEILSVLWGSFLVNSLLLWTQSPLPLSKVQRLWLTFPLLMKCWRLSTNIWNKTRVHFLTMSTVPLEIVTH